MPRGPADRVKDGHSRDEGDAGSPRTLPSGDAEDDTDEAEADGDAEPILGKKAHRVDVDDRPYFNIGKWFFSEGDDDYVGSAAFVGYKRVIMTAAHCVVSNSGHRYKNFLFIRGAQRHFYGWSGQRVHIDRVYFWPEYYKGTDVDWAFDYAFCYAKSDSGAGWLGLSTSRYESVTAVGYPSNYDDAKSMYAVKGAVERVTGGEVLMGDNDMGPGCSGGPWVGDLSGKKNPDGNMAASLNSNGDKTNYGPVFNLHTFTLYDYAKSGKSPP